jgi:hypothetical protein
LRRAANLRTAIRHPPFLAECAFLRKAEKLIPAAVEVAEMLPLP